MTPFIAEIIGTFILILLGCGINANNSLNKTYAQGDGWVLITLGWGLAVFTAVFIAGSISGAHINPAVTVGLAMAGKFPWADAPMYILGQMIGAYLGASFVYFHYQDHFSATEDAGVKLGVFSTGPAIPHTFRNILSEAIGTFVLVFGVFFLVNGEGLGSLSALPVGLLVVVIGMALGGTTGYAINPARDLGPRLAHATWISATNSNWKYSWIPVVGPLIGAGLAALLYLTLQ
jgi:glycerol uptake facilitator protein